MKEEWKNNTTLAWLLIILGGVLQLGWSVGLGYTESFTVWTWDIVTIVFLVLSMICLEWPMRMGVPFTTAYAVWIGVGVTLTVVISKILDLESWDVSIEIVVCIALIIVGVVGLKMTPVEYLDDADNKEKQE